MFVVTLIYLGKSKAMLYQNNNISIQGRYTEMNELQVKKLY